MFRAVRVLVVSVLLGMLVFSGFEMKQMRAQGTLNDPFNQARRRCVVLASVAMLGLSAMGWLELKLYLSLRREWCAGQERQSPRRRTGPVESSSIYAAPETEREWGGAKIYRQGRKSSRRSRQR